MPAFASTSTQPPSEPSRGQLAPPSASTVASASTFTRPRGVSNSSVAALVPAGPAMAQLEFARPRASSRRSQARSSGEALSDFGNTRPLDPTKVSWPSALAPGAQGRRRKRLDRGAQMRRRRAVAGEEALEVLAVGEVQPAAPGQQELPPGRRHAVVDRDPRAALAPAPRPPSARRGRRRSQQAPPPPGHRHSRDLSERRKASVPECKRRRLCAGAAAINRVAPTARRGCRPCSRRSRRAAPGPSRASSCNCRRSARACTAPAAR